MTTEVRCFNCETTDDVRPYRFDLDLPTIYGCRMCIFAIHDQETLEALKPRKPARKKPVNHGGS